MKNDLLKDCVDCRCVILSMKNQILFRGIVSHYDAVNNVIRVDAKHDCAVRGFVDSGDRIKLQIKERGSDERLALIEGTVEQAMQNFLFLTPQHIEEKSEGRTYFRQNVMLEASVFRVDGEGGEEPCIIVDISATGISIQSDGDYPVGERLCIKNQRLRENGRAHNMQFAVVRKSEQTGGRYRNFYGCRFENMPAGEQDRIFQDIFALQTLDLRSSKNR